MITVDDVRKHIPNINLDDADKLVRGINLLATKYNIDDDAIVQLLGKGPQELEERISSIESQRTQLKTALKKKIMEGLSK